MQENSKKWRIKLYSFSPWILGSACLLLLLVLAIFAITNYEREKKLITGALEQKGLTIVRFVSSAVWDSMRSSMMGSRSYGSWEDYMQPALELAVEQPGVESISIVDRHGNTMLTAGAVSDINAGVRKELKLLLEDLHSAGHRVWRRVVFSTADGGKKAVIATRYTFAGQHLKRKHNPRGFQPEGRFRRSKHFSSFKNDMARIDDLAPVYLLQLDFTEFSAPLKRQFIQIVLELFAIILVGIGGTLSFYTLRNLKGSEEKLDRMKGFNDVLVSSLPIGVIATGDSGTLKMVNRAAEKMTGASATFSMDKAPLECLPQVLSSKFTKDDRESSGSIAYPLIEELTLSGRSLEVSLVSLATSGANSVGVVMLLRDGTEIKRLESELQRNERLAVVGKMAAGVAQELRNPLSSIKGLALLMQSKIDVSKDRDNLAETFVAEVDRLNRSIGELLDYARPSKLNFQRASLAAILTETLLLLETDFNNNEVEVVKQIEDNLPELEVDRDKIRDVILNLLLNSLQAMENSPGTSKLEVGLSSDDNSVILTISDNGVGISSDDIKKVFDPYFTTKSSGTGLGLALSQKSVEEHGGKLLVESVQGRGTKVQLLLSRG